MKRSTAVEVSHSFYFKDFVRLSVMVTPYRDNPTGKPSFSAILKLASGG